MNNPAYPYQEYTIYFIAESSTQADYGSDPQQPELLELKDEEIAAIRAALHKITRRRILNVTDAEDLVQETLLTMITRNPGIKLKKGLLVWCQGILRNKVGNYYRKTRRQDSLKELHSKLKQEDTASRFYVSPETTASNKELQSIIKEKLAELSPAVRRVMELLVSGYKTGEIVDQLSPEPYQNVINRLYRGRKKLARELIKCGFGPNAKSARNGKNISKSPAGISKKAS